MMHSPTIETAATPAKQESSLAYMTVKIVERPMGSNASLAISIVATRFCFSIPLLRCVRFYRSRRFTGLGYLLFHRPFASCVVLSAVSRFSASQSRPAASRRRPMIVSPFPMLPLQIEGSPSELWGLTELSSSLPRSTSRGRPMCSSSASV